MNYKPSRNFLASVGLLAASFLVMHRLVIPSIAGQEMQAAALKAAQTRPALISGIFRKSAWEEFDEKAKMIHETNISYYIEKTDGKTTKLNPKGRVDESLLDQYVDYDPLDKSLVLSSDATLKPRKDEKPDEGAGENEDEPEKIDSVVFLVQFEDSTPVNQTASEYESRLFGPFGWVKKFYGDMTHGDIVMQGDVYGWYTFPEAGVYGGNGSCNLTGEDVQQVANFYGVDLSGYERVVTITNCEGYDSLGGMYIRPTGSSLSFGHKWVRIAGHYDRLQVNTNSNYSGDWSGLVWNMIHELGHSFGLSHSNALDCNEETIATSCINVEYGNPFDAMGGWDGRIFNFLQQEKAGWIDANNILIIDQPGNYHLDNSQEDGGIVGAKIKVTGIDYPILALEHRKSTGFDSILVDEPNVTSGLLVYSSVPPGQILPIYGWPDIQSLSWYLVDPHPTGNGISDDILHDAITATDQFYENKFGVSILINNVDESGIDFSINFDYENSDCGQQILSGSVFIDLICNIPGLPAVTNLSGVAVSETQIDLNWDNIVNNIENIDIKATLYQIPTPNTMFWTVTVSPETTSYSAPDPSGSTIWYHVRANNSEGSSAWTTVGPF